MKIARNILAVVIGLLVGGIINGGLISISSSIIPLPEGVDPNDMDSIIANMPNYAPKHFIMPFLAHAIGTFIGALIASLIAATHKMKFALSIGIFFILGGIYMAILLPAPLWFNVLDIGFAYIPMAWLAGKPASNKQKYD
jgi:hypothetical protein